ncbi:methylamine utilization protein [Sphingomonas sp. CGMCC 1.13654]|uniref:Methylamine utilization protein n=1 Tax=Sphingomonas chungangi TaxID=2683589 RepID=A0A838L3Z3_9SPHN|nr:methylamine utilization protein [Sphingomonas chungangi]MBA2934101.1 methylamine utilization protein [Sphingomonas chungangi]MVW57142.1 methylamine utilization protein [Sphingomonas chungangi]
MLRTIALLGGFLLAGTAAAGTVTVQVRGANGAPIADAVVMVVSPHAPAGPIHFPWPNVVKQQNISFQPHVLIAPVGADVTFPNMDNVRHHVYSFSKPKKFELKLYGHEDKRTVTFDKPGVVAIGCNIHDQMSGFIVVVDTPYAAKTDASGRAVISNVPDGAATLKVWSPAIRAPDNQTAQSLNVAGSVSQVVTTP